MFISPATDKVRRYLPRQILRFFLHICIIGVNSTRQNVMIEEAEEFAKTVPAQFFRCGENMFL